MITEQYSIVDILCWDNYIDPLKPRESSLIVLVEIKWYFKKNHVQPSRKDYFIQ